MYEISVKMNEHQDDS